MIAAAKSAATSPRGWLAPSPRNLLLLSLAVFLVSLAAFAPGFWSAKDVYFDETWYVPTAREWLATGEMLHPEHPPLAKMLIAAGMKLFGDNPFGWRFMPLVFGAVTVTAVWLWTLALTEDAALALFSAAITALDGVVFVQARIAMLDIFLIAFCMLALAAFTMGFKARGRGGAIVWRLVAGLCLGLAGACKWSGWFLAFGLVALDLAVALLRHWRVRFENPRESDFYAPEAPALGLLGFAAAYLVAPFLAYFLCYAPQMIRAGGAHYFLTTHQDMIAIMTGKSADHPYKSIWWTWPALWRPVWYLFDAPSKEAGGWSETAKAAAVVGLPNPFVLAVGQLAILWTLFAGVLRRARGPLIVAVAFFAQWLPWAANPKGLEFYYYYYPSVVCLGPALALVAASPATASARRLRLEHDADLGGGVRLFPACARVRHRRRTVRLRGARVAADMALTPKLRRGGPGFARVVAAFFIGGFAIFELLYCVQPLLPEFAREFGLRPSGASLAVSVSTVVMASTLFFAGLAAERFGRKPVMTASLVVSALATLGAALAPNWPALLLLRGLMGLALGGLPSLAMAYLADEIDGPALGFSMGMYIAGSTLGGMFGRLVVGFITDHSNWRVALAAIGANSLLGALFFVYALPADRTREGRAERSRLAGAHGPRAFWRRRAAVVVRGRLSRDGRLHLHLQLHRLPARRAAVLARPDAHRPHLHAVPARRREFDRDGRSGRALWPAPRAVDRPGDRPRRRRRHAARSSGDGGGRRRPGDLELLRRPFHRVELGRLARQRGQGAGRRALPLLLLRRLQPQRLDGRPRLRAFRLGRRRRADRSAAGSGVPGRAQACARAAAAPFAVVTWNGATKAW